MYYATATALLFSLLSITSAIPETTENLARGLVYTPRSLGRQGDSVVTITQTQEEQLTEISRGREIQLTKLVQDRLVIIDRTNVARDNIRKNHFRNLNSQQNIIIIVVTQIVDARDSSNKAVRYMTHQVKADNGAKDHRFIMVQQAQQMTINGASATGTAALPAGTGVANAASFSIYDPNAAPSVSNATQILPAGLAAPSLAGVQQFQDPAIIIEENQSAFVSFVGAQG
ncbi:Cas1p-like protein [Rutstroemia sp. NJR-2017a WRK4]|nr:Cas1p-like protein [Rutstroemia sp. NJR-2017a WRK4]